MRIDIMTLFPDTVGDMMNESILGRAQERELIRIEAWQIRDYTTNKQNQVDDYPYGGGHGAVLQADPLFNCWQAICDEVGGPVHTIYMSPCGVTFNQAHARRLRDNYENLILVCGHYEGIDQRFIDECVDEEISIGDYVLTGGELPAMVLIDTVARFIEGVLASEESAMEESVYSGLLEYPHYSKPREIEGLEVPEVLTSGNHGEIDLWRFEKAVELTAERRPEMLEKYVKSGREFSKRERMILEKNTR